MTKEESGRVKQSLNSVRVVIKMTKIISRECSKHTYKFKETEYDKRLNDFLTTKFNESIIMDDITISKGPEPPLYRRTAVMDINCNSIFSIEMSKEVNNAT